MKVGENVIVFFKKDQDMKGRFANKPFDAARGQKKVGIGGDIRSVNGSKFYVLKAKVATASFHLPACLGMMTLPQLRKLFKDKGGFCIEFCGTPYTTTFSWK